MPLPPPVMAYYVTTTPEESGTWARSGVANELAYNVSIVNTTPDRGGYDPTWGDVNNAVYRQVPQTRGRMPLSGIDLQRHSPQFWAAKVKYGFEKVIISADQTTVTSEPAQPSPGTGSVGDPGYLPAGSDPQPDGSDAGSTSPSSPATSMGPEVSFDLTGGTTKILQSIMGVQTCLKSGTPTTPTTPLLINAAKDKVDGCDVFVPKFEFQISVSFSFIQYWYLSVLQQLTGTMNKYQHLGFQPGELLYLGASGSYKGSEGWRFTYKFSANPNRRSFQIAPGLPSVPFKRGWDYLEVKYDDDATGGSLTQSPISWTVHQVYQFGDFRRLQIGGL